MDNNLILHVTCILIGLNNLIYPIPYFNFFDQISSNFRVDQTNLAILFVNLMNAFDIHNGTINPNTVITKSTELVATACNFISEYWVG